MTLPAIWGEAAALAALAFARDYVQRCRSEDWLDIGISTIHPDAGHVHIRQLLKSMAMSPNDPFKVDEICDWARDGWADADLAMRELWGELDNRGETVPPALRQYMRDLVNPHRRQRRHVSGAQKVTHVLQDLSLVLLLWMLRGRYPTIAFFGRSARKASVCGIVARAFTEACLGRRFDADAVRHVWKNWAPAVVTDPNLFKDLPLEKSPR